MAGFRRDGHKCVIKETGSKAGCLAGFWHYHMTTMSARMHTYRYSLFKKNNRSMWKRYRMIASVDLLAVKSICTEMLIDVLVAGSTDN